MDPKAEPLQNSINWHILRVEIKNLEHISNTTRQAHAFIAGENIHGNIFSRKLNYSINHQMIELHIFSEKYTILDTILCFCSNIQNVD